MVVQIEMPKLGISMEEGTVTTWLKKVGEPVKKGDPVVEIHSEKYVSEVEALGDGELLEIKVLEGETVPCHAVLGYVGKPSENPTNTEETQVQMSAVPNDAPPVKDRVNISPVARKMAEQAGLDIRHLTGTGPQGRISKNDVEKAISAQNKGLIESKKSEQPSKELEKQTATLDEQQNEVAIKEIKERFPVSGMRKVIATRMHQSLLQSAQLTIHRKSDITELLKLQKELSLHSEKRYGEKLTLTDFIARAVVLSLQEHPYVNSTLTGDFIEIFSPVHLGIAVAIDNGLVVPVIRHAETRSVRELSKQIRDLWQRGRANQLLPDEMQGSTFTISNLGHYGVEYFTPVLNPPETGILGVGAVQETPVFIEDVVERRSLLPLSFTFNHQVLDGVPAAEFLQTIKKYLEEPIGLLV